MHDDIFVIPYAGALERNRHLGCIFRPLKCVNHIFFLSTKMGGGEITLIFDAGGHMIQSEHKKSCLAAQNRFLLFIGPGSSKKSV
jgi:hypothetical protein